MSKIKPRKKYLGKAYIRFDEDIVKKKSKPWDKRTVEKERGQFDNVTMSDLNEGFANKGLAKKFAKHKYRQYME